MVRRRLWAMGCSCLCLALLGCEKKYEPVGPPSFDVRVDIARTISFNSGAQSSATTINSVTINGNKIELAAPAKADKKRFDVATRNFGVMKMELTEDGVSALPVLLLTKDQQVSIAALGKK
jgi:hypothetical protein